MSLKNSAIVMVSLFVAGCSASGPKPPPLVEVPAAGPADLPLSSAAPTGTPTPFKRDMEALCEAPKRAPGLAAAAKADRPRLMAEWISAQLETDRAKELMHSMGTTEPGRRHDIIKKEVDAQGITSCPFLDEVPH